VTADVHYLADASAITRLVDPEVAEQLSPLVEAGQVATCGVIDLTLFALVDDPDEMEEVKASRTLAFPWLETTDQDLRRALAVQALLAAQGQRVDWPTLIVAAVAERHGLTVIHNNSGLERISRVTGQTVKCVVPGRH
jgi:predicted nucleic acid-binding protein